MKCVARKKYKNEKKFEKKMLLIIDPKINWMFLKKKAESFIFHAFRYLFGSRNFV